MSQTLSYLDDDEKMNIMISDFQSPGRGGDNGRRVIVNESGVYELLFNSRKPIAKEFKRWLK